MKCRWPASGASQMQETNCIRADSAFARCARMKIPCHVPAPVQRKKRGKSTRVAQLEKKIDGLVSMIVSSQHIQASETPPLTPESHSTGAITDVPKALLQKPLPDAAPQPQPSGSVHEPPQMPLAIPSEPSTTFQLIPGFSFTLEEVLSYFDIYRREFMPNYPFVIIPENLDPRALYATSRCLFWTIMAAVTPQSSATQQGVDNWFRQYIADRMVVKQEKSLAILQAILLHLACLSSLFKRGNTFPWNNYLSQCCESLAVSSLDSDLFLVALVKMQRVADRAYSMLPGFDVVDTGSSAYLSPMDMVINNVRRELYDFINMQPDCVKEKQIFKDIFKAYYQVTLIRLAEPAIPVQSPTLVEVGTLHPEPLQRFETLWKCLLAAVDFFDIMFSIHPNELPGLPASMTGLMSFATVTSSRLLLLEPSIDWQPAMARKKLDFADVLKRLSDRFEDADAWAKEAGRRRRLLDGGGAQFCRLSFKLRWIRQWYLSRMPQEQPSMAETQPPSEPLPESDVVFWQEYEFEDALWPDFMTMCNPNFIAAPVVET
ncbi:hypothetical protein TARUN_4897 [Trichoderma arundinaceum]|uniref:Uncharacterized protein n=1 Tax=Trichoderma arundinaceum TaxID=490622 RepID=A0A395NMP4_TRIAR|nr:hypothetical protein TARUN_4897 [Trichoderma arundinaceum]